MYYFCTWMQLPEKNLMDLCNSGNRDGRIKAYKGLHTSIHLNLENEH